MRQLPLVRLATLLSLAIIAVPVIWAAPSPADKAFGVASQFVKIGNDTQATEELQKFLTTYPDDARVPTTAFWLGSIYQRAQKYDKALIAYEQVIAKSIGEEQLVLRADTHYQMAECYRAQKNYEKSARAYANCLLANAKITPSKLDAVTAKEQADIAINAQYWLAESNFQLKRYDEAVREYRKVLEIAPTHALASWACYSIGMIELNQGHFSEAITAMERMGSDYKDAPVIGETTFALGLAYISRARAAKDAGAKTADYRKAIEVLTGVLNRENLTSASKQHAALALAGAYFEQGDYNNAEAAFTRALLVIDPLTRLAAETHLQRAHALYNAKRFDDANIEYGEVTKNKKYADLVSEGYFWLANSAYQLATTSKDPQSLRDAAAALTAFLTPPGDKDAKAPRAALLLAYCYEDLTNGGEKDTRDKATAAFTRILNAWPGSDQAVQARAGIARLSRDMKPDELKGLGNSLPQGAASWDIALQLAYKEFTAGHYDTTLTAARQVLDGKPTGETATQATFLTAAALHKLGRVKEAIPYYQQITAMPDSPLAPYAQRGITQAYLDARSFSEAKDAALALIKLPAQGTDAVEVANERGERQMYLAAAYVGALQYTDAVAAYRKVVSDAPSSPLAPSALMNVAWIAETQKDPDLAITTYREFIAKYPDDKLVPEAFFQLGVNLVRKKEYGKAIDAFNSVPATSKLADQAAYASAWAYMDQGDKDNANKQFTLITEKFKGSTLEADCWYRLGQVKMEAKDYLEAMRYYTRAADLSKDDNLTALITYQLGTCAFQAEQYPMAGNAFGKIGANFATSPYVADALFWKAVALERQGAVQAALSREAYALYVTRYPAGEYVADAAVGAGRVALAAKQYANVRSDMLKAFDVCTKVEKGADEKLAARAKSLEGEIQFTVAQSYYDEKNYQQALREFAVMTMYKYEPWFSRSYLQMARCSAQLGDKVGAVSTLRQLKITAPDSDAAKQIDAVAKELGLKM